MKPANSLYEYLRRSTTRRRIGSFSMTGALLLIFGFFIHSLATPARTTIGSPAGTPLEAMAPQPAPFDTIIIVTQNNAIANNSSQDVIKVEILDALGNPTPGLVITFTVNGLNFPSQTSGDGIYYFTPSSGLVGTTSVIVKLNGVAIGAPQSITFIPGPPDPSAPGAPTGPPTPSNPTGTTGTLLSVQLSGAIADGSSVDSVKAHIKDGTGNVLPGVW